MRLFAVTFLVLSFFSPALSAETLDSVLAGTFASDPDGMRLLRESGGTYGGILTLERLPSGAYAVEMEVDVDGRALRYPVKLRRGPETWEVSWQPEGVYAAALVGMAKSGRLPVARAERRWVDAERMPALPIIGTEKRFVTPFGEVPVDDAAKGKAQGDLDLSPRLVDHIHRWVRTVLDEDPAPAGFDLILDRSTSWRLANKLVFNASVVGLYQISLVTGDSGELGVVRVSAPISTTVSTQAPAVVAMYALDGRFGLRISVDGEPVERNACVPEMTLCIDDPSRLPDKLEQLLPPGGGQAMFAAPADVTVGDAVAYLAAFVDYMGLGAHQVLMGYVQR